MKNKFKTGQLVLVRDEGVEQWGVVVYDDSIMYDPEEKAFQTTCDMWDYVMPLEGNEHHWKPNKGDVIAVRMSEKKRWKVRLFAGFSKDGTIQATEFFDERSFVESWPFYTHPVAAWRSENGIS